MTKRYLEDFAVGQTFGSGRVRVDKERIKSFAAEFDPQPFHLDEEAASRLRPNSEISCAALPIAVAGSFRRLPTRPKQPGVKGTTTSFTPPAY